MEKRCSLKEKVYNDILDGIVRGEYKGGQILNESELVKKYHISKSPVREALMILSSEGILVNIPRYGYQVVSFTISTVANIMEFRGILEKYALKKSFGRLSAADYKALRRIADACPDGNCGLWEHWDLNMRFHLKLTSYVGNEYIFGELDKAMHFLKLAYAQTYWPHWDVTSIPNDLKNHSLILDALEEKDLDSALKYLEDDLADFCIM